MTEYPTDEYVIRINKSVTSAYRQNSVLLQASNLEHYLEGMRRYGEDIGEENKRTVRKGIYTLPSGI